MRLNFRMAAPVLLMLTSLAALVLTWQSTTSMNPQDTGSLSLDAWERRLRPVRNTLPVKRGVIGYLADWDVPGIQYATGDQDAEFFLSQYALAPLVLVRGSEPEWTVAVFGPEAYQAWKREHEDEFEILPLKRNVFLLHRRDIP